MYIQSDLLKAKHMNKICHHHLDSVTTPKMNDFKAYFVILLAVITQSC